MPAQRFVRRLTVTCALAALTALVIAAGASAAAFYVDGAAAAGGDCLSQGTACKTIADAITKERATSEADTINVAAGTYAETVNLNQSGDGGLTIVGAGAGSDPGTNTLLESTSGGNHVLWAQAPDTLLSVRGVRVVVGGSATGGGIVSGGAALAVGRGDGPVVVDMANASNSSNAVSTGGPASTTSTLDHVTVGGTWTGAALFVGRNTTVIDSRLKTGPTSTLPAALMDGPGTAFFQRSVLQAGNPSATGPVASSTNLDVAFDSSEVLGGGVFMSPGGAGKSHTLTVASSTLDAGVLGNRDDAATYPDVQVDANGSGAVVTAKIEGSILTEGPKATVSGGGAATVTCTATDVASTTQAATGSLGAIDCASGTGGNVFTPSLGALFANPAPDYTLNPSSTAVESVPESAIGLPAGFTASGADLVGASRLLNGVGTCAAPIRDKGALELSGHEGVVPAAAISAPAGAAAGTPAAFAGSAANEPSGTQLRFDWRFSDGATATGQGVSHAFAGIGAAIAMLTVTAPGGCVGTATTPLTIRVGLDAISALKLVPSSFFAKPSGPSVLAAAKRSYGTVVRYRGSQAATTTFTVQKPRRGRKQAGSCRKPSSKNRHGKACTYYVGVGSFKHVDKTGAIHFRFTGRVKGHALGVGRYRLQAIPRNQAGRGRAAYGNFRIKG